MKLAALCQEPRIKWSGIFLMFPLVGRGGRTGGCFHYYFKICEIPPLKCRPSRSGAFVLRILCPIFFFFFFFFFKTTFSRKLFLRGKELILVLWKYFPSNIIKSCTNIQICYIDNYYETSLKRLITCISFLQDVC